MTTVDLIIKKRDGARLEPAEIQTFIQGVTDGSWADYQISAMLMAMFIRGLDADETTRLTLAMAASGSQFDLSRIPGVKVDKHSTGGVADTTTLVLAPLVAACGAPVVKLSGRGLGFTGGTIDKLESIPGLQVDLTPAAAIEQALQIGVVLLAQSASLTPADKKLYALRDVTGTVDSIPLIAASIMSKKIAAGADAIVLDVKCGSGAFMPDLASARNLARAMVDIGHLAGRQVMAIISNMDQPLGDHIGNSLEVIEAIEVLKGHVGGPLLEVSLTLGSYMLQYAGLATDLPTARQKLLDALHSGAGLARLQALIASQGGNPAIIDDYRLFPQAACWYKVLAPRSGYVSQIRTAELGRALIASGGGRLHKEDSIDYAAGLILRKRLHQPVQAGEELAEIFAATPAQCHAAGALVLQALSIGPEPSAEQSVILDVVV